MLCQRYARKHYITCDFSILGIVEEEMSSLFGHSKLCLYFFGRSKKLSKERTASGDFLVFLTSSNAGVPSLMQAQRHPTYAFQ